MEGTLIGLPGFIRNLLIYLLRYLFNQTETFVKSIGGILHGLKSDRRSGSGITARLLSHGHQGNWPGKYLASSLGRGAGGSNLGAVGRR